MARRPYAASAGFALAVAAVLGMTDGLVLSPNRNPTKAVAPLVRPLILQSARLTRRRYDALQIEGTNRRPPTEYELNRGKAIDALNADAVRFADAELDWSIYSEQIQLADPTGVRARGLANYKRFFQLVRLFRSLARVKLNVASMAWGCRGPRRRRRVDGVDATQVAHGRRRQRAPPPARRRRERAHRDLLVLDVENFHGQKTDSDRRRVLLLVR